MATKAANSVQFNSIEGVVTAYLDREVPAFAIFHVNQFLFPYNGSSMSEGESYLRGLLEEFRKSESAAVYTICVYEDLKKGEKIKNNTPCDGSFNFRLVERVTGNDAVVQYRENAALLSEINALRLEVKQLRDERENEETEEREKSGTDLIGQIIEHPVIAPLMPMLMEKLMGMIFPEGKNPAPPPPPAQVQEQSNFDGSLRRVSGIENITDPKLIEALGVLLVKVPELPTLLQKLATLSVKKPTTFNAYVTMLKVMRV